VGIEIEWKGSGGDEVGVVRSIDMEKRPSYVASGDKTEDAPANGIRTGSIIVRIDPRYFRPTEVDTLLGDPSKAREKLGWFPKISFKELVKEMVAEDYSLSERDALIMRKGYRVFNGYE